MSTRKPRQARAKVTVDTIIEAGFIAVALHGPSGTTTRHIAEIAGVSVGSLYEYFRHCCKVSDEAAFCLIQRPYISKTLLTRRIS
ncbi:TetR/AcrR family transcriptional regulator, partial [Acinetobacter baumannii]|uniref:TetR/AcrR family transcriptional regulator n=1 Tax=Acinetobacter baumannii TaxID=470 RepID=UPI0039A6C089